MASIDDGELYLAVEGASEDQLRRGLAAARASLEQSGVSIDNAFIALAEREASIDFDVPPPDTERYLRNSCALDTAVTAALIGCDVDHSRLVDFSQYLELLDYGVQPACGPHYQIVRADPRQLAMAV